MGIDFFQHKIKTGLFNLSSRNFRIRRNKGKSVNTMELTLFIVTFLAILSVTHVSITEPSEHRTLPNNPLMLSGSITDSSVNRTLSLLKFGMHFNETVNSLIHVPEPCFDLLYDPNKIELNRALITTSNDPILIQSIGNKAAHLYNGNVSKSDGKPRFPCTSCNKSVTARSKAISCDICDNWTHVQCTENLTLDKYDAIVLENAEFNYTCNNCIQKSLPFADESILDTSELENDKDDLNPLAQDHTDSGADSAYFRSKGLHFISLNARSLLPKISELRLFAQNAKPATICISETWLDDSITNAEIDLPGYTIERNDRNRHGGGVCLYIR